LRKKEEIEWVTLDEALPEFDRLVMLTIDNGSVLTDVSRRKNKAGEAWYCDCGDVTIRVMRGILAWAYYPEGYRP
jgi:hypothetical protein